MSPSAKFTQKLLIGAVESVARAGAKFFESLADDGKKALRAEAKKIEGIQNGVKAWRETMGEVGKDEEE